jgi:NADH:quinone reductase (non-electrogenic)
MTCQAGMPAGAHAADNAVATLQGREPEIFDFGYLHQPISLGRRDGLIQWVDRADRPKPSVLTGRRAALYKELVARSAVPTITLERRVPGALRWPSAGRPHAVLDPPPAAAQSGRD